MRNLPLPLRTCAPLGTCTDFAGPIAVTWPLSITTVWFFRTSLWSMGMTETLVMASWAKAEVARNRMSAMSFMIGSWDLVFNRQRLGARAWGWEVLLLVSGHALMLRCRSE